MFSHIVRQWVTLSFFVAACSFFLWKIRQNAKDDVSVSVCVHKERLNLGILLIAKECSD